MTADYDRNDRDDYGETTVYDRERARGGDNTLLWIIGAIVLVAIIAFGIYLFMTAQSAGPEAGVTVGEIMDQPSAFVGQTVTVSGEIDQVLGDRAVLMGGDLFDDSLLVLATNQVNVPTGGAEVPADRAGAGWAENDVIQVTGPVRTFNIAEFENELGVTLDEETFGEFEGRPAIMANQVDFTVLGESAGQEQDVTLSEILNDPTTFAGQQVTVSGQVGNVISDQAFLLGSEGIAGGEGLLVLGAEPIGELPGGLSEADLNENTIVRVQGTVIEQFNIAEFESEFGVTLDENTFGEWEGEPALVAQQLMPSTQTP